MVRKIAQPLDQPNEFFPEKPRTIRIRRKNSERCIVQSEFANRSAPQPAVRHDSSGYRSCNQ